MKYVLKIPLFYFVFVFYVFLLLNDYFFLILNYGFV